jgi:GR25 family glycosyltransferase involved in LPS biosynthesis
MVLKIGISYDPSTDLFLSGVNQTAITLGQVLLKLGHNITLIDIKNGPTCSNWWEGINRISEFELTGIYNTKGLDLFIDIDGYILPTIRQKIAANSIVFLRSFLQFSELDNSVYPELPYRPRDLSGVQEVWCWDILNPAESIPSIQTIFPYPIRRVPFIWSQWIATEYMGSKNRKHDVNNSWNVYICEKNNCNSSSCILPVVAVRELVLRNVIKAKYKCYNTEKLKENKFFKENVYNNIQIGTEHLDFYSDGEGTFYKMLDVEGSILLSHSRFMPLRIGLLNALWMGLPVIHNSPILRELHPILKEMFYTGNNIKEICERFNWFCNGDGSSRYYLDESLQEIRENILKFCGIDSNCAKWCEFMRTVNLKGAVTVAAEAMPPLSPLTDKKLIAFSDMWPGFNYHSNFIMDALRNELKTLHLDVELSGVKYQELGVGVHPDLVIFGPYSNEWTGIPDSVPKVFFSAENWGEPSHPSIRLWLTASKNESVDHIRIPTWMTFIDWFSGSIELPSGAACEDNPIRMPLSLATNTHPVGFKDRPEFCGFVVSNPVCGFRNETFKSIDSYKRVNSGGALYNNIGGQLSLKYAGGGCGDISKYKFFENHKFTISFENSQAAGYITEKVLHSKMAGCIPLYWGDADTDSDFVPGSIVNLSKVDSPEAVLGILKKLEENPELCAKIASTPILNEEKKQKAINIMSIMSCKLLSLMKLSIQNENISKISKTYVVNLDTRPDRWASLVESEPLFKSVATRISAVNGNTLQLTPIIYNLFKNNEFNWKKSVIGCYLSHIGIWSRIIKEDGDYFLVLEDDVRFVDSWLEKWDEYSKQIPKDADLLYLGGVLPPNKIGLSHVLSKINEYWSVITPNTFFSSIPLPLFHFCTYSYIITKSGAEKLLRYLVQPNKRVFNGVDHLLGSPSLNLKTYVATPLLTYCYQESDPNYVNSHFNDTNREDTFDSDIWNNKDCFTEDDIKTFLSSNQNISTESDISIIDIYYYSHDGMPYDLYERNWLEDVMQRKINMVPLTDLNYLPLDNKWFLVQRPYMALWNEYFKQLSDNNISFKVLHLSDEFGANDISFYSLAHCKAVLRNYLRPDAPYSEKVLTIPLGFHHTSAQNSDGVLKGRKLLWSFHGTGWFGRKEVLEGLSDLAPHSCHITPDWNHSTMTRESDYVRILSNTRFVPILRGNNVETFRLYEALEAGCVPIYIGVNTEYDKAYSAWLKENLGLVDSVNWVSAKKYMSLPEDKYDVVENYRQALLDNWRKWKERVRSDIAKII